MTVLIADDDYVMIRMLSVTLRRAGFATVVAFDVDQATQIVHRHRIDAVILDLEMPGGSGSDVIRRLKLFKRTIKAPIVVVSGAVEPNARNKVLELGADAFFAKPPDLDQLLACVHRLIASRKPDHAQSGAPLLSAPAGVERVEERNALNNPIRMA